MRLKALLAELIDRLHKLEGPDRELDAVIAPLAGYSRSSTNPQHWIKKGSAGETKLPAFTGSIDIAFQLAKTLRPDLPGGCSWEPGKGYAKLGENPPVEASGPAIAICIAAISATKIPLSDNAD